MRKTLISLISLFLLSVLLPHKAHAAQKQSGASAHFADTEQVTEQKRDNRAEILSAYLSRYNSPMADDAYAFVADADKYHLDWKLVAAIAGVESYFGQNIPPASYNGWGFGVYGDNVRRFSSWKDGIDTVSEAIREQYMDEWGGKDIEGIGARYAASPLWPAKVHHFMDDIQSFADTYQSTTLSISL